MDGSGGSDSMDIYHDTLLDRFENRKGAPVKGFKAKKKRPGLCPCKSRNNYRITIKGTCDPDEIYMRVLASPAGVPITPTFYL